MINIGGVVSDDQIAEMQRRNEEQAALAIQRMGHKYACHPVNSVSKDPKGANFTPIEPLRYPVLLLKRKGEK